MNSVSTWGRRVLKCLIPVVMSVLVGCGGGSDLKLGKVTGRVTLDGKPLANASVKFTPEGESRGSFGSTNEQGEYSLYYTYDKAGALVGEHHVAISSASANDEELKDPLLPSSYNSESKLRATVNPGNNTIDFALTSDGEVPEK